MTRTKDTGTGSGRTGTSRSAQDARTGRLGEQITARYLRDQGWRLLDRNWRPGPGSGLRGELDLVALDPDGCDHAPVLVALEVKTRRGLATGTPAEAVTPTKLVHLRHLAARWAETHRPPGTAPGLRVDVVSVLVRAGAPAQLRHHRGVTL
ncbi:MULTISPECIES: YraN family protein [unclassified Actinomyces]|uniref:YraN family protein n=1 Tax=unclassified Actinomyces TaxID=2609248 RepID=UPI0020178816|nr:MULTISPECIES: YraN family protein [unclassified Actinomyces]MCL3778636.1 YraN family protein [Actinomyces sp. AC-20-1]MCL3790744.1 YraN family protein [Actinomyces sp. 187325]MCL3793043.1 YraN family protein [Actinomyces sp. 186855]MCL3795433.1 YraN family protein [Actinomyces sp. 217892]